MLNPFRDVNWKPDEAARRKFGLSLLIGFPSIALVFLVASRVASGQWPQWPWWLMTIGGGAGFLFWVAPGFARPFYLFWYFISCCIGFAVGNLLFAALFYLVFTPLGLLLRLFGRLTLRMRPDKQAATYWRNAEPASDPKRYYRQF